MEDHNRRAARRGRIAFVRLGSAGAVNTAVAEMLRTAFPEYHVDVIDMARLLAARPAAVARAALAVMQDYGWNQLARWGEFREHFWRTPYLFDQMKQLASRALSAGPYEFSFQLGSVFDASLEGLPHFVYTDRAHLAGSASAQTPGEPYISRCWIGLEKGIYEHAARVFTRFNVITRSLIEHYGISPQKIACVYQGLDGSETLASPAGERDYAARRILFAGRDWTGKGGPGLLRAFEQVLDAHPGAHLSIVGCAPGEAEGAPNVEVVGEVTPEGMARQYRAASVFCLPDCAEAFPLTVIEAQSFALPVVAAPAGAVPEVVREGESGFLVPPGDVDRLAACLIDLLDDPSRCRAMGEAGALFARDAFCWESVGRLVRAEVLAALEEQRGRVITLDPSS